jgi:hypothetical protein
MNALIKQPRPTEYKGVRYRSKSEAILAFCMDKAGYEFEYEPDLKCDGLEWKPDFIVCEQWSGCVFLLEYKPCEPTETYKKWIANEFKKVKKLDCSNVLNLSEGSFVDTPLLYWNNFYKNGQADSGNVLEEWPENIIATFMYYMLSQKIKPHIENAKQYRFDLAQSARDDKEAKEESERPIEIETWDNESGKPADRELWFLKLICSPLFSDDWVFDILDINWVSHVATREALRKVIYDRKSDNWLGKNAVLNELSNDAREILESVLIDTKEIPCISRQLPDVMTWLRNRFLDFRIRELARQMDDKETSPEKLIIIMKRRQELEKLKRTTIEIPEDCLA